jgi:hypothetical protein
LQCADNQALPPSPSAAAQENRDDRECREPAQKQHQPAGPVTCQFQVTA